MLNELFAENAPRIMFDLRREFLISKTDAAAILGNAGHESAGFTEMKQRGGGDGLGICQWSGARRAQYMRFCLARSLNTETIFAGACFLVHELKTTQIGALHPVEVAPDLSAKVAAFERYFERAGLPEMPDRVKWAEIAFNLPDASMGLIHA